MNVVTGSSSDIVRTYVPQSHNDAGRTTVAARSKVPLGIGLPPEPRLGREKSALCDDDYREPGDYLSLRPCSGMRGAHGWPIPVMTTCADAQRVEVAALRAPAAPLCC